ELCTRVLLPDLGAVQAALDRGENPKNLKLRLAEEITALIHGTEEAKKARVGFHAAFSEGTPRDFVELSLSGKETTDALMEKNLISSKTELRRLIREGAVTCLDTGAKAGEEFLASAAPGHQHNQGC
ncbi:MAG: tyrosyl-tRNA synthetase, partial [Parcubacteria group bacterium Greene0416_79]